MAAVSSETLHATAVSIDGRAVLIEGPSGSGKSDLAIRLIDRGGKLVSDDQTLVVRMPGGLVARAPQHMAGRIELWGIGIAEVPHRAEAPVALVVRLGGDVMRMPGRRVRRIVGVAVREIALDAFAASAAIKVEIALRQPEATPA